MGHQGTTSRRGPSAPRGEIAEQILTRARESFAADGYAGTTLQGVARSAGVDTKLVRYYFGGKEALFEACVAMPPQLLERIRAAVDVPLADRGQAVVRAMLSAWGEPNSARVMRTSLVIAAHEPAAMAQVRAAFSDGLIPAIASGLDPAEVSIRGGLITSQMIGLSFARFIYALDDAADIPDSVLVAQVGGTIQRYLTEPVTRPSGSATISSRAHTVTIRDGGSERP